jgi:hypothetical protein
MLWAQHLIFAPRGRRIAESRQLEQISVFWLEPISKSSEEDNQARGLDEAEEILGVILPSDEDPTLPLNPCEETFDHLSPCVSPQPAPILRGGLAASVDGGPDCLGKQLFLFAPGHRIHYRGAQTGFGEQDGQRFSTPTT